MPAAASRKIDTPQLETRSMVGFESRVEVSDKLFRGYAIVFHKLSLDLGGFKERMLPESVDRTLREGLDVRAYFNHDPDKVLGRLSAGTLKLQKDSHGLRVEIDPPDTQMAKDLKKSVRRGDISGMSFRFRLISPDGDFWHMEDELLVRDVTDMRIGEISIVSEPAYTDTTVALRSMAAFAAEHPHWKPSLKFRERQMRAGLR